MKAKKTKNINLPKELFLPESVKSIMEITGNIDKKADKKLEKKIKKIILDNEKNKSEEIK